jgi:SAM-dependent methyltransferase
MPATDFKSRVLDYLKAFDARDIERCLSFCNEDTTFHFMWRRFRGRKGIEKWHRDRFEANLRVIRIDTISEDGNTVTVDVVITSDKLKPHKVNAMGGRITVRLERSGLKDVKFALRKLGAADSTDSADASLYRAYVGPVDNYDLVCAMQFNLLTILGLRDHHTLLDVGCGSLRAGRFLMTYLQSGHYFGIEPEQWLIDEAIRKEIGQDLVAIKQPKFSNDSNFTLTTFHQEFDFILAQSVFSHTSQNQMRRCLSEARKTMKPSGMFAATYFQGEDNYMGEEWVYPGHSKFRPDFMERLAREEGLVCTPVDWPHPHGQDWVLYVHRGQEKIVPNLTGIAKYLPYKSDTSFLPDVQKFFTAPEFQ